jgi:DNA-directed RNA polymerase specialized sigma24 family protein
MPVGVQLRGSDRGCHCEQRIGDTRFGCRSIRRRTSSRSDVSGHSPDHEFGWLDGTDLLSRLHSRDEATWISVIDHYEPMLRVLGRSYRLALPDVENAVQRTWLALLTHATGIRNAMCLRAWLASTMRRECLPELPGARSARHQLVDDWSALEGRCIDGDDACDAVAGVLDRRQLTTTVWELVDRLSTRQRCLLRGPAAAPRVSCRLSSLGRRGAGRSR